MAASERDVDAVLALYADDASVVRFEAIDQLQATDDVIVWDATMETGVGLLLVTNVFLLDRSGRIARHVPSIRGYWGKT